MTTSWQQYQIRAAGFFSTLGLTSEIEAKKRGARGEHAVDVFVSGRFHGIELKWVVECKHWKSNIPKEKVLALRSVIEDLGADRGFLLSEVGFQSGAIGMAKESNITLTSIDLLEAEARESLTQGDIANILSRRELVTKRLWRLHKSTGEFMSDHMKPAGRIAMLDLAIQDGLQGKFPTIYTISYCGDRLEAHDWNDLVSKAKQLLAEAEQYADEHEQTVAT